MPNSRLSYLAHVDNANQQAQMVEQSKLFPKLKYTLLHNELCGQRPRSHTCGWCRF